MGTYKVTRTSYSLNKPKLLTEEMYLKMRNSLPIYPEPINVTKELLKHHWFVIIIYVVFPPILLFAWLFVVYQRYIGSVMYSDDNVFDHYRMLNAQNAISNSYYSAIYKSNDYNDFISKYKSI